MHQYFVNLMLIAKPLAATLLVVFALFALLAVISPRLFRQVSGHSSQWIDSQRIIAILDRRFDIDRFVLPHSRLLGVIVLAAVVVLGMLMF